MITVTDRIDLGNYEYINLDARYTDPNGNPFSSVSAAQTYHAGKMNELFIGLTVLVKESGWTEAKEYWVQPKGTMPETYGLVEKGAGTTDYADLDNKPTISDGGQGSPQIPLSGNVKVTATSGQTTGVTVTAENGGITMAFTLEKGTDGVNGKSAYQQWLDEGNTGDETDFLNSLKAQIGKFIYAGYNATAAALAIGGTTTENLAADATDDSIVLMPNDDATAGTGDPTATMMFSVSVSDDPTPVTTYTYIGDVNVDASAFIGSDKIVQDLNTGGSDKVPSATAVKELNDNVVELSESINGTDEYSELNTITINLNSYKPGRFEKNSRAWDPTKGRTHIIEIDENFDAIEITANSTNPAVVTFLARNFANSSAWNSSWDGETLTNGGYYADNMVENGNDVGNFTIPVGEQRTFPVGNAILLAVVNRWSASEAEDGRIPASIKGMKKIHVAGNVEKRIEAVADKVKEVTYSETPIAIVQEGEGVNVFSGYIDGNAGEIKTPATNKYFLASIEGAERVAFPERVYTSNNYNHGWMLGTYDGNTFTPIDKGVFETGESTIRRKIVDVPTGATHIAVSIWLSNNSPMTVNDFYCYKITGKGLLDVIRENSTQSDIVPTIDIAQSPAALSLYNAEYSNDGTIKKSTTKLLTSRIYNDFFIVVKEGYMITHVSRVDVAGNVIDPKVVVQNPEDPNVIWPKGVLDSLATAGKRVWGTYATPTGIGYIVEIAREDLSDITDKNVIDNFLFADTNTELKTNQRYNGETFVDNLTNDNARRYTKASIDALLQRFKTIAMMQWASLKNIPLEGDGWVSIEKFKGGAIQIGVPYSRCATNNKWIGFAVSPETYLTALKNPYSVIYTENISTTGKSSEYGLSDGYASTNGATYYGLVCSAYVSYMYGFMYPVSTDCLGNNDIDKPDNDNDNTRRNYLISEHVSTEYNGGTTDTRFTKAIQVDEIPAMCAITTPGHTYFILDFILDNDGNRIAAVVTEETTPITRTALYTIERLQARFNSEYAYRCIEGGGGYVNQKTGIAGQEKIEVTVIKPSELDNRKNNLLFTPLYNVGEKMLKPYKDVDFDPNIMFYMGEKAVVMQYNTAAGYIKNTPYYLIVKPGSDYAKIIIEQQVEDRDEWSWEQIAVVELQNSKVAFSDNNTEYYKVDVTDTIGNRLGKFRACLSNSNESEKTGYTQWIILDSPTLTKRANNIIEFSEGPSSDTCPETVNIKVVFASGTVSNTQEGNYSDAQGADGENVGGRNYFNTQGSSTAVIVVKCDWGAAARCVNVAELS